MTDNLGKWPADRVGVGGGRSTADRAARRCTVILIAHRLSTVTDADQIVVLEHGQARAAGTHAGLISGDQPYRELAETQFLAV
ncbi:hypothetical protein OHA77_16355 [Streptosporangium sp. NBC_01639]|uniref:hypothetical protein n=1 Tax=Streptosporangium sp. NBC_01639 TaxID=2975948 RepID=UPI00386DC78A|nr:hypothetical protein OHA77_16355 [Streptosporangium sp. NBC_01639]